MMRRIVSSFDSAAAKSAVIQVGGGRGFVTEIQLPNNLNGGTYPMRIVLTAAHCLPHLPPPVSFQGVEEKTYSRLLGPLGTSKPSFTAECIFVDPVNDIAVLASPDGEMFHHAKIASDDFIDKAGTLTISVSNIRKSMTGWLLSLDGHWNSCTIKEPIGAGLTIAVWITDATKGIERGMSGSPILLDNGSVIGVLAAGGGTGVGIDTEGGPNPNLNEHLPYWLVQRLRDNR